MKTMQAVQYSRYGEPDVLELHWVPVPAPGPGEVLVRVYASGLNPKDAVIREGRFRQFSGRGFPKMTGFDLAGEVADLGEGVTDLRPGERVWGFLDGFQGGAAAEYVAVPRGWLSRMPSTLDFPEAAALPLVGLTALQVLRDKAALRSGERLLVKGASGGVGSAAIGLAKARGAHVTAIASAGSLEHCRALGADEVLDYARTDPAGLPGPFDVVLDCYGASPFLRYRRLLSRGGRFVTVAPLPSIFLAVPLSRLLPGPRAHLIFVKPRSADLAALAGYVDSGALRMPIEATYPLERVREAHTAMRNRHARGKRVLLVARPAGEAGGPGREAVREAAAAR